MIVNRIAAYADAVRPMLETNPPAAIPPLPSIDEQSRADALVLAFGSAPVEALYESWRRTVWDIIGADGEIGMMLAMRDQGERDGVNYFPIWRDLEQKLRPAQKAARRELAAAIAVELRSRPAADGTNAPSD